MFGYDAGNRVLPNARRGGVMKVAHRVVLLFASALFAAIACAQGLPIAKPESVGMSTERLGRIKAALQREIDADRMPGAVVMIARKGKLVYSESIGYQDKAAGTP